jgi:transcriptional regulator with XRE-family HTH domain
MSNKSPDSMDAQVGQAIRAHRLMAGLSQTELADRLGITFQQVQKYEKGMNRVGAGRLSRIARILGVPIATFFGAQADPTATKPSSVFPHRFVSDRNALRLMTAYADIRDRNLRLATADLVEAMAKSQPRPGKSAKKA